MTENPGFYLEFILPPMQRADPLTTSRYEFDYNKVTLDTLIKERFALFKAWQEKNFQEPVVTVRVVDYRKNQVVAYVVLSLSNFRRVHFEYYDIIYADKTTGARLDAF